MKHGLHVVPTKTTSAPLFLLDWRQNGTGIKYPRGMGKTSKINRKKL